MTCVYLKVEEEEEEESTENQMDECTYSWL